MWSCFYVKKQAKTFSYFNKNSLIISLACGSQDKKLKGLCVTDLGAFVLVGTKVSLSRDRGGILFFFILHIPRFILGSLLVEIEIADTGTSPVKLFQKKEKIKPKAR